MCDARAGEALPKRAPLPPTDDAKPGHDTCPVCHEEIPFGEECRNGPHDTAAYATATQPGRRAYCVFCEEDFKPGDVFVFATFARGETGVFAHPYAGLHVNCLQRRGQPLVHVEWDPPQAPPMISSEGVFVARTDRQGPYAQRRLALLQHIALVATDYALNHGAHAGACRNPGADPSDPYDPEEGCEIHVATSERRCRTLLRAIADAGIESDEIRAMLSR